MKIKINTKYFGFYIVAGKHPTINTLVYRFGKKVHTFLWMTNKYQHENIAKSQLALDYFYSQEVRR